MAQVAAISQQIWDMKYRLKGPDGAPVDKTIEDSWRRVAAALAEAETPETRADWADGLLRRPLRLQVSAGRPDPGGRGRQA